MTKYDDIRDDFNLTFDGDPWGNVMHWWFTIADEIYFNRSDLTVPQGWQFKPSPLGPTNDADDYATITVQETGDTALIRFGLVLDRYAQMLKHAGQDY